MSGVLKSRAMLFPSQIRTVVQTATASEIFALVCNNSNGFLWIFWLLCLLHLLSVVYFCILIIPVSQKGSALGAFVACQGNFSPSPPRASGWFTLGML